LEELVPIRHYSLDDHHQDGEVSEPVPNDSAQKITFSQDDSRVKEKPTYVDVKDQVADICTDISRLSEGHEDLEEFATCVMLLTRRVISESHSCPATREQMRDFSRQTRAMFSKNQPPSCQEALSQIKRVLLPNEQELHSFNACVETKAQYTRKRRAEEVCRETK
jgi:hypothetical protein